MKKLAILCDIDGTVALKGDRDIFDFSKVDVDLPNPPIVHLIHILQMAHPVVFLSGRMEEAREGTNKWMEKNQLKGVDLFFRKDGDRRKDTVVKQEIYKEQIEPKYNILFVLDDRNQVVKMWREIGLTCLQVADGDF